MYSVGMYTAKGSSVSYMIRLHFYIASCILLQLQLKWPVWKA